MMENVELVNRGFRILVGSLSGVIGQEMSRKYGSRWWNEVLDALSDQKDLPYNGNYGDLVDALDIANCIRIVDRRWMEVFRYTMPMNCRTWAKELMGIRNEVAHIGQQDLEQPTAERALDTMALLCQEIDPDGAEEIRELYQEVRSRAGDAAPQVVTIEYTGLAQPESDSKRGELTKGSLLKIDDTSIVEKTTLTRKVTYGGKTVVYPVYRVRLDKLYYNDQNDRIATWISRYESEHGASSLNQMDVNTYNGIIENFIYESNPEAIQKTQKNIALVGQREPGVTLADGRIVDGNRRYTCLRRLQQGTAEPLYFETVIMDMDIQADKKQIKLLELAIQHGEEKKVDYDLIDYAIGTYRDIVQTKLLTVEEYAQSTNESVADVKKRLEVAEVVSEFLAYLKLPEQYHVAREYQVYSLFQEMMTPLRKLNGEEKQQLKHIAFNNAMLKAMPDQRKFIRDIKGLINSGNYKEYFENQKVLGEELLEKFANVNVSSKADVDQFASENEKLAEDLQMSMERALLRSRTQQMKAKPSETVSKCISQLLDIDSRMFSRLEAEDREFLKAELDQLIVIAERFKTTLE